jgi:prepilin-type N-terminal cleavage/methylation domain-containing protein
MRLRARNALTLIELLVVITIIGVLIALLFPAMSAAREAARRMKCQNNIRQLAVAVLNYEQARQKLPAAGAFAPPAESLYFRFGSVRVNLRSGPNHSWIVSLLPQLELSSLYGQFDLSQHVGENSDNPQAEQPTSLLCPSDDALGRTFSLSSSAFPARLYGKANYAAYTSPFHVDDYHTAGAIRLYGQRLSEVVDGASKTIALSEVRTRDEQRDQRGAWALPWSGATLLSVDAHPKWFPLESPDLDQASHPEFEIDPNYVAQQTPNSKTLDVLYACPDPVSEQLDRMPCSEAYRQYISASPRSNHPGGVNVTRLDASSQFLSDDIDRHVMAFLVAANDEHVSGE